MVDIIIKPCKSNDGKCFFKIKIKGGVVSVNAKTCQNDDDLSESIRALVIRYLKKMGKEFLQSPEYRKELKREIKKFKETENPNDVLRYLHNFGFNYRWDSGEVFIIPPSFPL